MQVSDYVFGKDHSHTFTCVVQLNRHALQSLHEVSNWLQMHLQFLPKLVLQLHYVSMLVCIKVCLGMMTDVYARTLTIDELLQLQLDTF